MGLIGRSYEFTDDEIAEAFKFIDLDKNSYIGAAEIRHILVCMGELVTDEEIDAMIYLVDSDGDG
jgi:calmodulin